MVELVADDVVVLAEQARDCREIREVAAGKRYCRSTL